MLVVWGGGLISASIPPVAGSGVGTDGWQMLLRSPTIPLDPAVQKPSRPPMSPIPGTEQIPPERDCGWAPTVAVPGPHTAAAWAGATPAAEWAVMSPLRG